MDGLVAAAGGGLKIGATGAGRQIYAEALRPQPGQHRSREHLRRDGIHHRVKGRGQWASRASSAPHPKAFRLCPLGRAAGADGHMRPQCRQPYPQRLPHRAKAQQQDRAPHRVRLRWASKMPMHPSAVGMALRMVSSSRAK